MSGSINTASASLAAGIAAVSEAVRNAAQSPADQVRLLSDLAAYSPAVTSSTAPIGSAIATAQSAAAALCRRSALISLCIATSNYQPYSSQDAIALRDNVVTLLDAEMLIAADGGDLATWQAFRDLRSKVVTDLIDRAAQLPAQRTVTTQEPLPSLLLAYQLYGDASRSDDLIARVDPIHPAFMPVSFEALSS